MKKRILLFTSSIVLFSGLITSYEAGPGHAWSQNYSGGPGSSGTCISCHTGSSVTSTTSCTIEVRKLSTGISGPIVTMYQGDTAYIVTVKGANTNGNLLRFGFNFMALKASNTTQNAGTFSSFPANVDDILVGGRNIVEQTSALVATTGPQYSVSFNWTAPVSGTGTVNMYGIINAVNNNNSDDAGDKPSTTTTLALQEATTSVVSLNTDINVNAYPNPVIDKLNLELGSGEYGLKVFDLSGKLVASQTATGNTIINTANWAPGIYQLYIAKDGATRTISILK